MTLWRLYYHLVWTTKNRQPLITSNKEQQLYNYILGKAQALNCQIHAIDGIEDHIHVVVTIPPSLAVSEFVKKIKGSSSHHLNHSSNASSDKFAWQEGYGVFSLGYKQLKDVVIYVQNQKIHHSQLTTHPYLEPKNTEN
ncbi:IS200/IS605 family transposase [Nostoc sp. TCL26-01]|uniref:IS200/IS605 family transposase n=1 Tax=Nostoc sp. TCL26-01 TaxID=2576904 RepID=UPI0015BD9608|nr:IS200/IS605 family transposase [Nostoc sp. TCL26-01]QLE54906.1 IS200/IS605 family transposase [Nostoc sp. TCL26-01]